MDVAALWRLRDPIVIGQGDLIIIFVLRIRILFHLEVFDEETEAEFASYTELRSHSKFTIVNIDDSLANVETHAYPLLVLLAAILDLAEHFE